MKPREFFVALMALRGTNPNAIATAVGLPIQPTLQRFKTGQTRNPREDWVGPVAEHLGVEPDAFRSEAAATKWAERLGLMDSNVPTVSKAPTRGQARIDPGVLAMQIGDLLRDQDDAVRAAAAALFSGAALKPDDAPDLAQRLRGLLATNTAKQRKLA